MSKKAFTIIEITVVVLIVLILAAAVMSRLAGSSDKAKWSEAKASAGTIRTMADIYRVSAKTDTTWGSVDIQALGMDNDHLNGTFFSPECYSISFSGPDHYIITVDASKSTHPKRPDWPAVVTLDEKGQWTEN